MQLAVAVYLFRASRCPSAVTTTNKGLAACDLSASVASREPNSGGFWFCLYSLATNGVCIRQSRKLAEASAWTGRSLKSSALRERGEMTA